jgi:alpha-beta hydrolase superfamily lysophospholipase
MQHEYRDIPAHDGLKLKALVKENGAPVWLVVTHGMGEHFMRHQHLLKLFPQQYNFLMYDLRGHGRSEGDRANVRAFGDFRQDLQSVLDYLKRDFHMKRFVLFGHSLGGLITADWLQNLATPECYPEKVFLSSPPVGAAGLLGPLFGNAPLLVHKALTDLPVSVPLSGMLDLRRLSHDGRVLQAYMADELVQLKIHSHLFFETLRAGREVFSRPLRAACPLFVSIGTGDGLVNPAMLVDYFTRVEKNAKLFKVEDGYHELHNEIEKYRAPYVDFLKASLGGEESP